MTLTTTDTVNADTRKWTDASTKRTNEGTFMKVEGDNVVIKLASGKSVNIAIARLSAADQNFIKEQPTDSAKPAAKIAGQFTKIIPPASTEALPVTGKGDKRKSGLKITNKSDQDISKLDVSIFLHGQDGKINNRFSSDNDEQFGKNDATLKKSITKATCST